MYTFENYLLLLEKCKMALEGWGSLEDGIPDFNVWTKDRPVNPYNVYLEVNYMLCQMRHIQDCSHCSNINCGDNTTKRE